MWDGTEDLMLGRIKKLGSWLRTLRDRNMAISPHFSSSSSRTSRHSLKLRADGDIFIWTVRAARLRAEEKAVVIASR